MGSGTPSVQQFLEWKETGRSEQQWGPRGRSSLTPKMTPVLGGGAAWRNEEIRSLWLGKSFGVKSGFDTSTSAS